MCVCIYIPIPTYMYKCMSINMYSTRNKLYYL